MNATTSLYLHGRTPLLWRILLLVVAVNFWMPLVVSGWGQDGHEIVGNLAYKLLSDATKASVDHILINHPALTTKTTPRRPSKRETTSHLRDSNSNNNTPLGAVADWADKVRVSKEFHWSAPLHYIDIHDNLVQGGCPVFNQTKDQRNACHFVYDRDCHNEFCVAGAIVNYTEQLVQWNRRLSRQQKQNRVISRLRGSASIVAPWSNYVPSWWNRDSSTSRLRTTTTNSNTEAAQLLPPKQVQESLMFLTHFVGDIHQPLHSARTTDRGGNTIHVTFDDDHDYTQHQRSNVYRYHTRRNSENYNSDNNHHYHHHPLELHEVWDTSIIFRAIHSTLYNRSRGALEDELFQYILDAAKMGDMKKWLSCPDTRQSSAHNCTSQWAEESFQNALEWAYKNADGKTEVTPGTHLSNVYYETRLPKIKHFLAVAGVRLAASLELALGSSSLLLLLSKSRPIIESKSRP